MGMAEQQLKEIAVCEMRTLGYTGGFDEGFQLIKRFLAALPKPEPVGHFIPDSIERPVAWNQVKRGQGIPLYREPSIAPPASEQKPVEDDAPFYDVEDEAKSLCDELLTCGIDRRALQRALSKAYAAGNTSPQPDYKAQRDAERWGMVETLMFLGNVELNQDDDGGYSILLEPAENIVAQHWIGNSPEEAIDASIASVKGVA